MVVSSIIEYYCHSTCILNFKLIFTVANFHLELLNEDDLIMIIQKMKKADKKIWPCLLTKLNEKLELDPLPEEELEKKWRCLVTMILKWEKQNEYQASKKKFARLLYLAAKESLKEETDLINEIVRALDMTGRFMPY